MDLGLAGRRALVTGASSGLGLSSAAALAAEGVRVVMVARDADRLGRAAASVEGDVHVLPGDVSDIDSVAELVATAAQMLGGLDILVANAGGPPAGTFASTELDAYLPALELNLLSTVAMCTAAVPLMRDGGWGRIVAITSISVREPIGNLILSNTARAGLTGFLKTLSREVAGDGITVNSLQPGLHRTPRLVDLHGDAVDDLGAMIPAGVVGDPDDFGAIAAFLCSDAARFVTGAAIPVDGGAAHGLQ
ncbi:MAG: SDR family oxidoreductase [Actinobacteria bacterium]|nr:SDR family oxidoreductase [Actinomycetota bacterium]